jgi:hypothetical protein
LARSDDGAGLAAPAPSSSPPVIPFLGGGTMVAYRAYFFGLLFPDERPGVFLHGFPADQAVAIDVQAHRVSTQPGAFIPNVEVVGHSTGEHVDGTLFHTIDLHNISTSTGAAPRPAVTVAVISETLT